VVHISGRSAVPHQITHTTDKRSCSEEDVAHNVEREPIIGKDREEEREVSCELEKVGEELDVEDVHRLVLPRRGLITTPS
jgi:hypothetical protein